MIYINKFRYLESVWCILSAQKTLTLSVIITQLDLTPKFLHLFMHNMLGENPVGKLLIGL